MPREATGSQGKSIEVDWAKGNKDRKINVGGVPAFVQKKSEIEVRSLAVLPALSWMIEGAEGPRL